MRRLAVLLALLLLAACDGAPSDSPADATRQRLVGTWLRAYEEDGTQVRRILVLEAQGEFRESSIATRPGGQAPIDSNASGQWVYDGTNLKRRYLRINGKPLSAPTMPYATFEVRFPSKSEFIGVDHVRKFEVHYERVADGTLP